MTDIEDGELLSSDDESSEPPKLDVDSKLPHANNKTNSRKFQPDQKLINRADDLNRKRKSEVENMSESYPNFNKRVKYADENKLNNESHNGKDNLQINQKKNRLCKYYSNGDCKSGSSCTFMHEEYPCKYHHDKNLVCYSGANCKYSHEPLNNETQQIFDNLLSDSKSIKQEETYPSTQSNKAQIDKTRCLLPTPDDSISTLNSTTSTSSSPLSFNNRTIHSNISNVNISSGSIVQSTISTNLPHKSRFSDRPIVPINTIRSSPYAPLPSPAIIRPVTTATPTTSALAPVFVNPLHQPRPRIKLDLTQPPPSLPVTAVVEENKSTNQNETVNTMPRQNRFGPKAPVVETLQEKLKKISDKINKNSAKTSSTVKSRFNAAVDKTALLSHKMNPLKKPIEKFKVPISPSTIQQNKTDNQRDANDRFYRVITQQELDLSITTGLTLVSTEMQKALKQLSIQQNAQLANRDTPWQLVELYPIKLIPYNQIVFTGQTIHRDPLADPRLTQNPIRKQLDSDWDNDLIYGFLKAASPSTSIQNCTRNI